MKLPEPILDGFLGSRDGESYAIEFSSRSDDANPRHVKRRVQMMSYASRVYGDAYEIDIGGYRVPCVMGIRALLAGRQERDGKPVFRWEASYFPWTREMETRTYDASGLGTMIGNDLSIVARKLCDMLGRMEVGGGFMVWFGFRKGTNGPESFCHVQINSAGAYPRMLRSYLEEKEKYDDAYLIPSPGLNVLRKAFGLPVYGIEKTPSPYNCPCRDKELRELVRAAVEPMLASPRNSLRRAFARDKDIANELKRLGLLKHYMAAAFDPPTVCGVFNDGDMVSKTIMNLT